MAQEFLQDMLGIEVGLGSISTMEQSVSEAIAAPVEEAHIAVKEMLGEDFRGFTAKQKAERPKRTRAS